MYREREGSRRSWCNALETKQGVVKTHRESFEVPVLVGKSFVVFDDGKSRIFLFANRAETGVNESPPQNVFWRVSNDVRFLRLGRRRGDTRENRSVRDDSLVDHQSGQDRSKDFR